MTRENSHSKLCDTAFAGALAAADEARQHTGAVPLSDSAGRDVTKPPIGIIARAELRFLRGVARAGFDPNDTNAVDLLESAIKTVDESAASLPDERRASLLQRFEEWNRVVERIRGEVSHERDAPQQGFAPKVGCT